MSGLLSDPERCSQLGRKLRFLAWYRYGLRNSDADDVIQETFAAYCEVGCRYPEEENHIGILVGIFRNKARDYLDRRSREKRLLDRYVRTKGDVAVPGDTDVGSARTQTTSSPLSELLRNERSALILQALAGLRPEAREAFALLMSGGGRSALLAALGVNKNTADSRLHVYRRELREALRSLGLFL